MLCPQRTTFIATILLTTTVNLSMPQNNLDRDKKSALPSHSGFLNSEYPARLSTPIRRENTSKTTAQLSTFLYGKYIAILGKRSYTYAILPCCKSNLIDVFVDGWFVL